MLCYSCHWLQPVVVDEPKRASNSFGEPKIFQLGGQGYYPTEKFGGSGYCLTEDFGTPAGVPYE
ncbi:MAG: hypothetical protein RMK89_07090 [Armatimonadota bacterium]|nr:hypothetical protein [Armatimonadota bacterium]MDW8143210.1 hypothetical protein [Armatimonadota bacterium]